MLEIKNLNKIFGEKKVLDNLNLFVKKGDITGISGKSGAGKTTLLRIINLIEHYQSGTIKIERNKVNSKNKLPLQRTMAKVFQKPAMFSGSVIDNVGYGLKIRAIGNGERKDMAKEALNRFGLKDYYAQAKTLSGGEAQRVALAQAIVLNPKLLLLDEPSANLDKKNILILEKVLLEMQSKNSTSIIISSHDSNHLKRVCNKIYALEGGKLQVVK